MKQYVIAFVSGAVWQARAEESLPSAEANSWWRVEKLDYNEHAELVSRGTWLVNMNNVEAIKEN